MKSGPEPKRKPRPQPAQADWRYRAILALASPLIAIYLLRQAWQARDARLARQKLGLDLPQYNDRPLWIHMASVGEVNAAEPLIAALRRRHPDLPILVTTFTPTGGANAVRKFGPAIDHVYLPLDFGVAVRRFLRRIRPRCALIMETEIWPRLFHQCRLDGIPLVIVNGRLSFRTLQQAAWVRRILERALTAVDHIHARSQRDVDGFAALGMPAERMTIVGNLKYAQPAQDTPPPAPIPMPRPTVVAASTHDDEEWQLARAWLASPLRATHLLVLVPRHPKRKRTILEQLRPLGARLAVRSDGDPLDTGTEIHLADTFGELQGFIAGATLVFIGGSLIPQGGQNVIEVARLGKAVLFGPHMYHFVAESEALLAADAAIQVRDIDELMRHITDLAHDPERRNAIGTRARQLVETNADIAERYAEAVEPWLQAGVR